MSTKRKRAAAQNSNGLAAGERLKRHKLASTFDSPWGWVGTEVKDASNISEEHLMASCGFARNSSGAYCPNRYTQNRSSTKASPVKDPIAEGELADDVIVVSDSESSSLKCSKKACRKRPNCVNYVGQEKWEDKESAEKDFLAAADVGRDPTLQSKEDDIPVGLRNLGATCYANAYIQVWFQNLAFRNGVFQCQPAQDKQHAFEDSPIFHLQVTFAALQEGVLKVFNPVNLVESLKLRTNEQQDAQEFSKLFMSHLDTEFQKQSDPALKRLLSDQFQGKQAYVTTCKTCGTRSERDSDFLELEVNLENNASLESRIAAMLEAEELSGDNKYSCEKCGSYQDATRQIILRELPPVLHLSLLRFVFDISTYERKKSKHNISYPTVLDMNQFLYPPGQSSPENIYDLQGVLLHKGPSAYSGHYEAQAVDIVNNSWFQFNDESVTKMKPPGSKVNGQDKSKSSQANGRSNANRKKRRIEDSDDEVVVVEPSSTPVSSLSNPEASYATSKDAYMLVYTRRTVTGADDKPSVPTPPPRALEVIMQSNAEHQRACEEYQDKLAAVKERFNDTCQRMVSIYKNWHVTNDHEKSIVASQQALERFLTRDLAKEPSEEQKPEQSADSRPEDESEKNERPTNGKPHPQSSVHPPGVTTVNGIVNPDVCDISIGDIVCRHGRLDPNKTDDMKRISLSGYDNIQANGRARFVPVLTPHDVCPECVEEIFKEKLYQYEHPKLVAEFDKVAEVDESQGWYYISTKWIRDWRSAKPKMHMVSLGDPPPDAEPYAGNVKCPHGNLEISMAYRTKISPQAYWLLKDIYPQWETLSYTDQRCSICEAGKDGQKEERIRSEQEKMRLKHMFENALSPNNTRLLQDVPCALIPAEFARAWRQYTYRPLKFPRPGGLDTTCFVCEHNQLNIDPNSNDLDTSICVIRKDDWNTLNELYPVTGPLVEVVRREVPDEQNELHSSFVHDIPVCEDCRRTRKSDFDLTEVTIRILGADDPNPTPETFASSISKTSVTLNEPVHQAKITTYSKKNVGGPQRQSKRLRTTQRKERKLAISKNMSVKAIKLLLQEDMDIPTICQRLFYQGHELMDNEATVASLGFLSNDIIDLREVKEDVDLLDESDTDRPPTKKRREEGRAFGGTLLSGDFSSDRDLPDDTASEGGSERGSSVGLDEVGAREGISCPACTYRNPVGAAACEMCETPLRQ